MDLFSNKALTEAMGDPIGVLVLFLVSTVLGLIIAVTYGKTHRGYSQSFSVTIVLITVITTLIIILIEDNIARAVGIFGAFSIIRFRTAVKDVRDIAFIFFALASGLAIGVGGIGTGVVGVLFISALMFALHASNFGGEKKYEYVLHFKAVAKNHPSDALKEIMDSYIRKRTLLNVEAKERGETLRYTFQFSLRDDDRLNEFISGINGVEGISDVQVVSSKSDIEF